MFKAVITAIAAIGLTTAITVSQAQAKQSTSSKKVVRVATFNLEWFGLGGDLNGDPSMETRIPTIRKFLAENVMPVDVMSFEEVVDMNMLQQVLPQGWQCITYDNPNPKHQHVAVCTSAMYDIGKVSYDDNYTIEEVAIDADRSRPAVRVNILDKADSKHPLFTLVAMHLKAMPEFSETRRKQAEAVSKDLANNDPKIPVVFLGDLNSFKKDDTNEKEDDIQIIEESLNSSIQGVQHVDHKVKYTFRKREAQQQFDHFYVKGDITPLGAPSVFQVCNNPNGGAEFKNLEYYNKNISDHCPVSLNLELQ